MPVQIDLHHFFLPFVRRRARLRLVLFHRPFDLLVRRSDLSFIGAHVAEQTVGRWRVDDRLLDLQFLGNGTNFGFEEITDRIDVDAAIT